MRVIVSSLAFLLLLGCGSSDDGGTHDVGIDSTGSGDVAPTDSARNGKEHEDIGREDEAGGAPEAEAWTEPEPHPVGMVVPPFALEDINPTSATFGQVVHGADLAGKPYGLIFLDSRCSGCGDVADGLWAAYQAHPSWFGKQPTFAVERAVALEKSPESVAGVVDGNSLPYLADTEETNLWLAFMALNHDFFSVSADGKLEVWLGLYTVPEDLQQFVDFMTGRYGE